MSFKDPRCYLKLTEFVLSRARRRLPGDVHDGRPEKVLCGHEKDGQQEAGEGDAEAEGKTT